MISFNFINQQIYEYYNYYKYYKYYITITLLVI